MKPYELYRQWSEFDKMMDNNSLSLEEKMKVGGEWVKSLPPKLLCTSSQLSYDVVVNAMNGRLSDLKERINGSTIKTPKEEERQTPSQGSPRSRKKPL